MGTLVVIEEEGEVVLNNIFFSRHFGLCCFQRVTTEAESQSQTCFEIKFYDWMMIPTSHGMRFNQS